MRQGMRHQQPCCATSSLAAGASRGTSVAVIGGGVGGLVVAGLLARQGLQVTLLEQNTQLGGRCTSYVDDQGFRFDTGPSLLLFPDVYRDSFAALGTTLQQHVDVRKIQPAAYRVHFAPSGAAAGGSLDLLYDVQAMADQLEEVEAGAGAQYKEWLKSAQQSLKMGMERFIARDFASWGELLDPAQLLPLVGQVDIPELLGQHHARLARRFKDPRLCALLSFQDLYVGLSPYDAPGVFSLLAATEVTDGVWYPMGGFQQVVKGLVSGAQEAGVTIRTQQRVTQIVTTPGDQRVTGVQLEDGSVVAADVVVANRDVPKAYGLLDSPYGRRQQQQLAAKKYSAGVISFNWGVDKQVERLLHHNVFLSDQFEASWRRARTPQDLQQHPNFYVHVPTKTDPSAAPRPGCESVMVLLPVANLQERGGDDDYRPLIAAGREAVLNTLAAAGVGDLGPHIVSELVIDPVEWDRRYALQHGAAFGMSHGLDQLAMLRPGCADEKVRGLYFVGASSRPGNGVPLVMLGAGTAARRIVADLKQQGALT